MKKLLVMVICLAMTLGLLAGCSSGGGSLDTSDASKTSPSENAGGDDAYTIYLISMDQVDQHWVYMNTGCEEAVAELAEENIKVNYRWLAPEAKDDAKQIECINNAVAAGADAILIAANSMEAPTAALEEAMADGVTVVYVDSPANAEAVATVATDNKAAGSEAAKRLLAALTEEGVTSGTIGIIGVYSSTTSTVSREEGFREVFDKTDFTLMETQYCEGDASKGQNIASNYITQGVVGIFATNEASTIGAGNAVREDGGNVLAVGFDKPAIALELVADGYLVGIMAQNPDVMGYEGVKAAVTSLTGGTIENTDIDTGVTVIDASNVADYQ